MSDTKTIVLNNEQVKMLLVTYLFAMIEMHKAGLGNSFRDEYEAIRVKLEAAYQEVVMEEDANE